MSTMIQIRNVPDDLHRLLKSRAALEGVTLSDYLLREIRAVAARPSLAEMQQRLAARSPVQPGESLSAAVRAQRDAR